MADSFWSSHPKDVDHVVFYIHVMGKALSLYIAQLIGMGNLLPHMNNTRGLIVLDAY